MTVRRPLLAPCLLAGFALLASSPTWAQTSPPPGQPPPDPTDESPIELSPFVVQAETDEGYAATDSLAGTRLRTPLKDIAASVSVVTRDFLDDLGATNLADLLVYTTGTEVADVGGNFSNSRTQPAFQNYEEERDSTSFGTRVRGLAGADATRNFFESGIPLDAYNTQSVTINRGAKAVLFGFGSPAGIIENSTILPAFRNKGRVQLRVGSFGTYRGSIDLDHVLVEDKLAVRIATVDDNERYEQDFTFRDQERIYGALSFKPFQATTIRVNAETGKLDQRKPRVDPPVDSLSSWWDFGQQTRPDSTFYPASLRGDQKDNNLNGLSGQWEANPGIIYYDVNTPTPDDARVSNSSGPGGQQYSHRGPRDSKGVAQNILNNPLAAFTVAKQIADRSVFDYREELIEGRWRRGTLAGRGRHRLSRNRGSGAGTGARIGIH